MPALEKAAKLNPLKPIAKRLHGESPSRSHGDSESATGASSHSLASTHSVDTAELQFLSPDPLSPTDDSSDLSDSKSGIPELIAQHGSSSATAWLESTRYKVWRPSQPIPQSSFPPVVGYLQADPYIFAWGNPLVSGVTALASTCRAFYDWAKSEKRKLVWCCVDGEMEKVLGGPDFRWSTLSCIVEDVLDPSAVVDLVDGAGGGGEVKDLKKNLRRAEREHVTVREVLREGWTDSMRKEVEDGIEAWKQSRTGMQVAATSFQPWLDFEHRRYFISEKDNSIIGILILAEMGKNQYQIKNAASFPDAPRGASEELIYRAMHELQQEAEPAPGTVAANRDNDEQETYVWQQVEKGAPPAVERALGRTGSRGPREDAGASTSSGSTRGGNGDDRTAASEENAGRRHGRVAVTFGVSASDALTPVENLSGWRVSWLSKTYRKVVKSTKLTQRGDFRSKFGSEHMPMYICYPADDGFGLDGLNKLMKCLRQ